MQTRRLRVATVAALSCAALACGMPTPPTAPSQPAQLEIRGTTLLMPGAHGKLTAWAPGGGELREVPAEWTVEGDAVSVASSGAVIARTLGQAIVRATYRDHSGTVTVHVVSSFAGTWRGSVTVLDCWQSAATSPSPCEGRRGMTAPLALEVTQRASADNYDNLRATVGVFSPPATGSFIGAVDSSGLFFLEGAVERGSDGLSGAVKFRWQLEGDRLVPSTLNAGGDDIVGVDLSVRTATSPSGFSELWRVSAMTR